MFGAVEITEERKCVLIAVPDRSGETLIGLIKKFILPGSVIISDGWKAYNEIKDVEGMFYEHEVVVHKHELVRADGTNTNTIEGTWAGVKGNVPVRKRTSKAVPGCLMEFMWRRKNEGRLWDALLEALALVRYEEAD